MANAEVDHRARRSIRALWNFLAVLFRWLLIFFFFFYGLALVTALFEAHAFQRLVSQLIAAPGAAVSQAQKQEVLIAVDAAADRLGSAAPKEDVFSQIAVRLDGLYGAVSGLQTVTGPFKYDIDTEAAIRAGEQYREVLNQIDSTASAMANQLLTYQVDRQQLLDRERQQRAETCSTEATQQLDQAVIGAETALRTAEKTLEDAMRAGQVDEQVRQRAEEEADEAKAAYDAAVSQKTRNDAYCGQRSRGPLVLDVRDVFTFRNELSAIRGWEMVPPAGITQPTAEQDDGNPPASGKDAQIALSLAEFNAAKQGLVGAMREFPGQQVKAEDVGQLRDLLQRVRRYVTLMLTASAKLEGAGYQLRGGLGGPEDQESEAAPAASLATLVPEGYESVGPLGSTWLRLQDQTRDATVPAIRWWLTQTGDYSGDELESQLYDGDLADAVNAFLSRRGLRADGEVYNGFRREMNAYIADEVAAGRYRLSRSDAPENAPVTTSRQEEEPPVADALGSAMTQTLGRVERALNDMEDALAEGETQTIRRAREMSKPLAEIKAAALALQTIKIEPQGSDFEDGLERTPEEIFQEESERLRQAIGRIEKVLDADLSPDFIIAQAIGDEVPNRHRAARAIWRSYVALGDFQSVLTPFGPEQVAKGGSTEAADAIQQTDEQTGGGNAQGFWAKTWTGIKGALAPLAKVGFSAQRLSTSSSNLLDLMVIFVVGAIGSLIYITKYQLNLAIHGRSIDRSATRSIAWYFFRPVFGIVVAFALFLLYKAGQIALGAGITQQVSTDVNLPILSILALFAGLLAWDTLTVIESKGQAWLAASQRTNLWATGLENAAAAAQVSLSDLARHVGVSDIQVERWLACIDKVTPEMQDRICTYLDKRRSEVFGKVKIENLPNQMPRLATGLAGVMAKRQLDDAALAELLGVPAERVRGWREQEIKVSPVVQLRLAEQLRCSHRELFAMGDASNGRWGVGLRNWIDRTGITSQAAAERLGEPVKRVRDWIELVSPVSPECQRYFEETLKPDVDPFREKRPDKGLWAVGLRQALREKGETAEALARHIDTNVERVYDWMAMDDSGAAGRVAKPTRERISKYVGKTEESLFSDQRPEAEHGKFRELIGKSFMEAADAYVAKEYGHGHTEETVVAKIAEELGVEAQEIERWRKGERKVPAGTAERVGALLGAFTAGSLFQ